MSWFGGCIFAAVVLRWLTQLLLERLNERNVRNQQAGVPESLRGVIDPAAYARSVEYTLAKTRLRRFELSYETVVLLVVLFSGILPWCFARFQAGAWNSPWGMALILFLIGTALSVLDSPFSWYAQFRLEARFGFNTSTQVLWWMDRLKALVLGAVLGYPLLVLILFLIQRAGSWWWLWTWVAIVGFQLLVAVLAPVLIFPLFNEFTPLPEGSLRERLFSLAQRTSFQARSINVMDGSKRSRHSNAFFSGFGRFRKIVLFDTLLQQLLEPELEAVLAHEIGHFKRKHIPKLLLGSALVSLGGFYLLSWLAGQPWFYRPFGFSPGDLVPALLIFALLSGVLTFWFAPLANWWSRRYEYQADAFAAETMLESNSLVGALRKLSEKNLSNLTPHPLYSRFYYSHPTLLEREQALLRQRPQTTALFTTQTQFSPPN
jgi:STE24 endopeptidase